MSIIDRMVWDTKNGQILDEDRRYVMLRADVLMGIFNQLPEPNRQQALESFMLSVETHGANSVAAYWKAIAEQPQVLLDTMINTSAQLGWGVWKVQHQDSEKIEIQVTNSPFATASPSSNTPVCTPIIGIMASMGRHIFNSKAQVTELICTAQSPKSHSCIFVITLSPDADH